MESKLILILEFVLVSSVFFIIPMSEYYGFLCLCWLESSAVLALENELLCTLNRAHRSYQGEADSCCLDEYKHV